MHLLHIIGKHLVFINQLFHQFQFVQEGIRRPVYGNGLSAFRYLGGRLRGARLRGRGLRSGGNGNRRNSGAGRRGFRLSSRIRPGHYLRGRRYNSGGYLRRNRRHIPFLSNPFQEAGHAQHRQRTDYKEAKRSDQKAFPKFVFVFFHELCPTLSNAF